MYARRNSSLEKAKYLHGKEGYTFQHADLIINDGCSYKEQEVDDEKMEEIIQAAQLRLANKFIYFEDFFGLQFN